MTAERPTARAPVRVVTLGCRLNAYESEVIRAHAETAGLDDTVVVNTCAVTREAERQARQTIRRLRREHPGARIIVTGCAAQIDPGRYAAMPEVDQVLGNTEKLDPAHYRAPAAAGTGDRVAVSDIMQARRADAHLLDGPLLDDFGERVRPVVQVQQGCDHRCTFCVIPFGRGPSRSVPAGRVVDQVRRLVAGGAVEAVLSGVDLTSYGADLPGRPALGELVRRVLDDVPALERLRLSSIDPAAVDDALVHTLADDPRLMPHLHLSLQAADDTVLKRMKRRHTRAQALELVGRLRDARPGLTLGADLIAGFPTESDAMFESTLRFVEEADIAFLHVFPFSAHPGLPAARMPQVPVAVRKQRAARLRAAGDAAMARLLASRVGRPVRILVERDGAGRTEEYLPARLSGPAPAGRVVAARGERVEDGTLLAREDA